MVASNPINPSLLWRMGLTVLLCGMCGCSSRPRPPGFVSSFSLDPPLQYHVKLNGSEDQQRNAAIELLDSIAARFEREKQCAVHSLVGEGGQMRVFYEEQSVVWIFEMRSMARSLLSAPELADRLVISVGTVRPQRDIRSSRAVINLRESLGSFQDLCGQVIADSVADVPDADLLFP